MRPPPVAQFLDHGRRDGYVAVLAALGVADVKAGRVLAAMDVPDFNADGFAHPQPAVVHEPEAGAEARFAHRAQNGLHLRARQDYGQDFRLGDANFFEDRPAGDLDTIQVEAQQSVLGRLHGTGLIVLVLAQKQKVLANLVLRQSGRVTLEMLGQFANISHVLFFGRRAIIFKLDKLLELSDGRIVKFHMPGRMPLSEGNFPAKCLSAMQAALEIPCRAAAQFNKSPEPTAVGAVSSAVAVHATSRRWLSFFR